MATITQMQAYYDTMFENRIIVYMYVSFYVVLICHYIFTRFQLERILSLLIVVVKKFIAKMAVAFD